MIVVDKLVDHINYVEEFLEKTRHQERIDIMKSRILEGVEDTKKGTNNTDLEQQKQACKTPSETSINPIQQAGDKEEDVSKASKVKHD